MARKRTNKTQKRTRPDWGPTFLAALAESGNISGSAKVAGVAKVTIYQRRDREPEFHAAMVEAIDVSIDTLEGEARRRAFAGVEETVFGSGGPGVGTVPVGIHRKYSDVLLMFLLKAHRPGKFRDNVKHEHTGADGLPIRVQSEVRVDVVAELHELAAYLRGSGAPLADGGVEPVHPAQAGMPLEGDAQAGSVLEQ